jgi:hypothetical protein
MLMRPKNLHHQVNALIDLFKIPATIEQLLLGNMHRWLALHIDEQIVHNLNRISVVWKEGICGGTFSPATWLFEAEVDQDAGPSASR